MEDWGQSSIVGGRYDGPGRFRPINSPGTVKLAVATGRKGGNYPLRDTYAKHYYVLQYNKSVLNERRQSSGSPMTDKYRWSGWSLLYSKRVVNKRWTIIHVPSPADIQFNMPVLLSCCLGTPLWWVATGFLVKVWPVGLWKDYTLLSNSSVTRRNKRSFVFANRLSNETIHRAK